jgi:hypothetical protein
MEHLRTAQDDDVTRRVVAQWAAAGPALDEVRRQEVAALTARDALRATIALLEAVDRLPRISPRPTSGLVEQQRLFMRARPR